MLEKPGHLLADIGESSRAPGPAIVPLHVPGRGLWAGGTHGLSVCN